MFRVMTRGLEVGDEAIPGAREADLVLGIDRTRRLPNSAPSTCTTLNTFGMIDLTTGAVSKVTITGVVTPKGMVFVP